MIMSDAVKRSQLFDALADYPLPAGIYIIRRDDDGQEFIAQCNLEFARMFGYDSIEEVVGISPLELHRNHEDYQTFISEFVKHEDGLMRHYTETLRTRDGLPIMVELHVRADLDEHGHPIGRTGIVLDISDFEQLLKDIGQILHHFTSTMTGFEERLHALHDHLTTLPDPFGDLSRLPEAVQVDQIMDKPAAELQSAVAKLVDEVETDERKRTVFRDDDWETIVEQNLFLQVYKDHVDQAESRPPALRESARNIINICRALPRGYISNETLRLVNSRAAEVERLVCLLDLHLTAGRLLELDHEVHMLREVALDNIRHKEAPVEISVDELMTTAQRYMQDFAASRDIELKVRDRTKKATVIVNRRDMMRAIQNLLHNAIKYSWSKRGEKPWVEIRSKLDGRFVIIEIENYGVPIPRHEIESGLIFNLGSRGKMSGDRSRLGTGIGLYDSQRVASQHGGVVEIRSSPARMNGDPDDLDQPFVTVASLRIPVAVRGY